MCRGVFPFLNLALTSEIAPYVNKNLTYSITAKGGPYHLYLVFHHSKVKGTSVVDGWYVNIRLELEENSSCFDVSFICRQMQRSSMEQGIRSRFTLRAEYLLWRSLAFTFSCEFNSLYMLAVSFALAKPCREWSSSCLSSVIGGVKNKVWKAE